MAKQSKSSQVETSVKDPLDLWSTRPDVVRRFLEQRPDYEQLCTEIAYILNKKLKAQNIETSAVVWRAKTLNSFLNKLGRKKYTDPFQDITDFAGVRVVCLYLKDIPSIERIVNDEFEVLEKVDKLNNKGVDQFGYGAIHFVVKLGKGASGARYDDLKDLLCEIQVRTVLQDAWAIIDHHLVYKNESDVPSALQRKLNSLAGLFETADDQFERVRAERMAYLAEVSKSQSDPQRFLDNELNQDSLLQYLQWKFPELPVEAYKGDLSSSLELLDKQRFPKLSDIDSKIERAKHNLEKLNAEPNVKKDSLFQNSISQMFLALVLADKSTRDSLGVPPGLEGVLEKYIVQ